MATLKQLFYQYTKNNMTTLRKKIFISKIQKIISQNNFVLFFQFNNIKFKDWILLKNQIFHLESINIIVIKNKIPYENIFAIETEKKISSVVHNNEFLCEKNFNKKFSRHHFTFVNISTLQRLNPAKGCLALQGKGKYKQSNAKKQSFFELNGKNQINLLNQSKVDLSCSNEKNLPFHFIGKKNMKYLRTNEKKLDFLCQGPTLMIAFNSIKHCKAIYEILNIFTYNFPSNKFQFKHEFLDLHKCKTSCLHHINLPSLFTKKENKIQLQKPVSANEYLQKSNFANQKNIKFNFFFIGGLLKGKNINYLDFEKLLQLNNSVYTDLIQQYSSGIVWFMLFNTILKIKLMKCFQINLINLLGIRKNNLKKISN